PEAALGGSALGLKAVVNDTDSLTVEDDTPNDDGRYRARFHFDPNDFDPGVGNTEVYLFFAAEENPVRRLVSVELQRTAAGGYRLAAWTRLDDSSLAEVGPFDITNAPHAVELDWKKASAPGANDGSFRLWIDAATDAAPPAG